MCRFIAYKGEPIIASELLHEPKNSLIHQSYHAQERQEPLNGDGFGFGWYEQDISPQPALFRSTSPAWNDQNLRSIAELTRTDCLFAHVRAATHGEVSQQNCHPFRFKNYLMMHNGTAAEFEKIKRSVRRLLDDELYSWVRGQTDSEHLFALFLTNLKEKGLLESVSDPEVVLEIISATIYQIEELKKEAGIGAPSLFNLVVTNGLWMVGTRYITDGSESANTLYYSEGAAYECHDGVCRMRDANDDEHSVLIVSEKLTEQKKDWSPIPVNHGIVVGEDFGVTVAPLSP